jgi:restriction system protein
MVPGYGYKDLFESLRSRPVKAYPSFEIPQGLARPIERPHEPGFLARLVPGAMQRHNKAVSRAVQGEIERQAKLGALKSEHERGRLEAARKAQAIAERRKRQEAKYLAGDLSEIHRYVQVVLTGSNYPDGFPARVDLAYVLASRELIIERELPTLDIVPAVAEFKYIKTRDTVEAKARKPAEVKSIYEDVIAGVALRSMFEVLNSDVGNHIDVVTFSGYVNTVDRATGKDIQPHLISVRVTKERFSGIDLTRIDKRACLRSFGAQLSPQPAEMIPVKPIVEFNMVDKRFVEQGDVLSGLESRPNLMELNPWEFEALVGNLFGKMGLESKLTRSSRDGGVDVVAFDQRPVLGGKVVIQAKRYRHTVGVSAVRDLFGTMMNEGANKGILVTTSGYGPDAFDFAKDKPIELIDGPRLLYLLEHEADTKARIVFPSEV